MNRYRSSSIIIHYNKCFVKRFLRRREYIRHFFEYIVQAVRIQIRIIRTARVYDVRLYKLTYRRVHDTLRNAAESVGYVAESGDFRRITRRDARTSLKPAAYRRGIDARVIVSDEQPDLRVLGYIVSPADVIPCVLLRARIIGIFHGRIYRVRFFAGRAWHDRTSG